MAEPLLTIAFDAASLAEIARLFAFEAMLAEESAVAMSSAGDLLTKAAQDNTWTAFKNPTGLLADSIAPVLISPFEVDIEVGVPYAHRLEAGFHGADSLGRVYDEAAEPYAQPALDANQDKVIALMDEAILRTWARVGGI